MRVLHVTATNSRRGAETFALDLADALRRRGIEGDIRALADSPPPAVLPIDPVPGSRFDPRGLLQLRRMLRAADVAIAHGSSTLPALAIVGLGVRTPFVYRGIGEPLHWSRQRLRRARTAWSLSRATAVTAIWSGTAADLESHLRVPASKLTVIPRGVPADRFPPATDAGRLAARAALGLDPSDRVLAIVGSLSEEKRVDLAIDVAAAVDDVHLLVAGDGPLRPTLEAEGARRLGHRAHFLGRVEDPAAVYAACDSLLLTSTTEGIPGVVVEAAFSQRPAVCTLVGGVPDVVVDGVTGRTAAAGDLAALVAGAEDVLRHSPSMGAAARAHCLERFELEPVADQWAELLRRVAG